ncbi:MAG: hypothetical protein QXD31_01420, partial [Candidatus Caldarchaeum sp.]
MSGLFRFHNYSPFEKVYAALLFVAGLSLRDVSERYCLTSASRESVRCWVHRLGQLFTPERRCRRLVAVDETVEKASGHVDRGPWYPWALKRLGIEYFHETFGERGRIERWFRELKERTRRFYNNINSKKVKSIEEI